MVWGIGDQAVSSATNFAISFVAARNLSVIDFGGFSVVFVTYTVALGLYRAVAGDPLLVRYSDASSSEQREGVGAASGVALLVGLLAGGACLLSSFAFDEVLAGPLRALAVTLPGLLLQDLWRFAFFAQRRGQLAFFNDVIWAVALVVGLILVALDKVTSSSLIVVWGGAGTLAAVAGAIQVGSRPRPERVLMWWSQQRDLVPRFLAEFLAIFGAAQLTIFGIGAVIGLSAVGALRGAWILLGPLNVPLMASGLVAIPQGVRLLRSGPGPLRRLSIKLSIVLLASILSWGTVLLLVPDAGGLALLHENWSAARSVLLPLVLAMAGTGLSLGAIVGLRALAAARRSLTASTVTSILTFTGAVGAALVGGLEMAAWTLAAVSWFGVAVWWRQYVEAIADHVRKERALDPMRSAASPK